MSASVLFVVLLFFYGSEPSGGDQATNGAGFFESCLLLTNTVAARGGGKAGMLRQYTGRFPRIDDPLMRAAYIYDVSISAYWYGRGTADWDQKAAQMVLNGDTSDYLYTSFTPLTLNYAPGSRPLLERIARRLVRPEMSTRAKVFAVLKYCHGGFRDEFPEPKGKFFLNMREEELLQNGGGQCEDRARLICCLCQIAGLPARFVASYTRFVPEAGYAQRGGHAVVEIYIEGGWCFFDSLDDFYCLRPDGRIAGLWDLVCDPQLVAEQPEAVYKDCGKTRAEFVKYRDTNLNKKQVLTLTNYSVWDGWRYDWKWIDYAGARTPAFQAERRKLFLKLLNEIGVRADKVILR